jgi:hypothetical protein
MSSVPRLRKSLRFHTTAHNHESNEYSGALGVSVTLTGPMRITIVCPLKASEFEPFDVSLFEVGKTYEVGPKLGALLIVSGCAEPEMRREDRADDTSQEPRRDR